MQDLRRAVIPAWRAKIYSVRRLALALLAAWIVPGIWAVADAKARGRSVFWTLCRVSGPLAILFICVWWPLRRYVCLS